MMPRTYKRKENSRKYGYSGESMQNAIKAINEQGMSIKKAAFLYGINRTTLMNHVKQSHAGKVGRPTVLTPNEEALIVHALKKLGDWGFGIDRQAVQSIVIDYLNSCGRQNPFKCGKPGIDWMYAFESRWKTELSRRVGQPLPANRAYACNSAVVDDFFQKLEAAVERLDLKSKPQNIFNVDESGFQTDIGSQKLFCKRGLKNPHKTVASSTKTMYTVQVCCSANGDFLPLYVIYKGLHLYNTWCVGGPPDIRYNCSPSGWMESQQFVDWFEKVFIEATGHLEGNKLLIFDGHNSHISSSVVELAAKNDIELLCLPAHTSSILQPLDVGVFKTVKASWRKCLRSFYDKTRYSNVDKRQFPKLLKELVDCGAFTRANAISAFEACGIYPLNQARITADKLATSVPLTSSATNSSVTPTDGPAPSPSGTALTAMANNTSQATCGITQSTPSQSSSATVLTPRKGIEAALLSHLQYVTPTDVGAKRVRIKRTLAESLTSEESRQRLKEAERIKSVKSKGHSILKKKRRLANSTINDELTGAGNRLSVEESTREGQHIAESSEVNTSAATLKPVCVDSSSQNLVELQEGEQTKTKKKTKELRRPLFRKEDQPKLVIRKPTWMNNQSHKEEQPAANSGRA